MIRRGASRVGRRIGNGNILAVPHDGKYLGVLWEIDCENFPDPHRQTGRSRLDSYKICHLAIVRRSRHEEQHVLNVLRSSMSNESKERSKVTSTVFWL